MKRVIRSFYAATIGLSLFLSGCATLDNITGRSSDPVSYTITSTPSGAMVLVNGEQKGVTPLTLTLDAKKRWVGVLFGGWRYENNFYYVEAVPQAENKGRYLSAATYVDPHASGPSATLDLRLPPSTATEAAQPGSGTILGIGEPILPPINPAGAVRILQINGKPVTVLGATAQRATLTAGRYSLATWCTWQIGSDITNESMSPVVVEVEGGKTYQLKTRQLPNRQCQVKADVVH